MAKKIKLAAGEKLPAGSHLNLRGAGVASRAKWTNPATGKEEEVLVYLEKLEPGQTVEVDVVEQPDRLEHAVGRGHLSITWPK